MSRCRPTAPASEHGLSLLELLITISLLAIFMAAVYESVISGLRVANASDEREAIRQQLANTLDLLIREASIASNVDNAEDQRFQFDADLDGNGTTENNVNYNVSSGDLQRTYNGITVTLIRDLSSLDFNFVDSGGSTLSTPVGSQPTRDTIRVVQITVTATNDQETISLTSAAYLRNNS